MGRAPQGKDSHQFSAPGHDLSGHIAAGIRPTEAQRRYLERALKQVGGKLPLFDRDGREVSKKTVESCVAHGWAAPLGAKSDQAGLAGLPALAGGLSGARPGAAAGSPRRRAAAAPVGHP